MRAWLGALAALVIGSCVYDPDERCDEGQRADGDLCICLEGMVPAEIGCEPCGDNASADGDSCVCDEGFARSEPDGPCEEASAAQGMGCDPDAAEAECEGAFPHCQPSSFDGGYCTTTDCTDDEDCAGGYVCDDRQSPSFCARPPVGMGAACESDADCEGTEATYCVTVMMGGCAVQDCSPPDEGCPPGTVCCDLTDFGLTTLCTPEALCPN